MRLQCQDRHFAVVLVVVCVKGLIANPEQATQIKGDIYTWLWSSDWPIK